MPVVLMVALKKNSPVIDFSVHVDNRNIDSHRLCVLFDSEIASKFSIADHQFGLIRRPVVLEKEMALWDAHQEQWNEFPIAIETCQIFVDLENGKRGVAVIPKGVREYEIVGENFDMIRLTLLRTCGHMGKENLIYHPGRASDETVIETPDALYFVASAETLEESIRLAVSDTAAFLEKKLGLDFPDAYRLLSATCDIQISQVVNDWKTVRVRCPKLDTKIETL